MSEINLNRMSAAANRGMEAFGGNLSISSRSVISFAEQPSQIETVVNPSKPWVRLPKSVLGVIAGFVALTGVVAEKSSAKAVPQTIEVAKGQSIDAPPGTLGVGDGEVASKKLYPYPQSGEFGNMTWFNEWARVTFPYGGKIRLEADREYQLQKMEEMLRSGCQEQRGCNGVYVWHYPGNLPAGGEVRHTGTGATEANQVCPEPVLDKIIKPNAGRQIMHEWSKFDGDGFVFVDGKIVYTPDNNRRTGQQVRNHSAALVEVDMKYGGDYECVGQDLTMEVADRRFDAAIQTSKQKMGFDYIDQIDVWPGSVTVTRK